MQSVTSNSRGVSSEGSFSELRRLALSTDPTSANRWTKVQVAPLAQPRATHLTSRRDAQMQAFIRLQPDRAPLEIGYMIYRICLTQRSNVLKGSPCR